VPRVGGQREEGGHRHRDTSFPALRRHAQSAAQVLAVCAGTTFDHQAGGSDRAVRYPTAFTSHDAVTLC
jgi:hypothetical protein